jgi:hypothetical protein
MAGSRGCNESPVIQGADESIAYGDYDHALGQHAHQSGPGAV